MRTFLVTLALCAATTTSAAATSASISAPESQKAERTTRPETKKTRAQKPGAQKGKKKPVPLRKPSAQTKRKPADQRGGAGQDDQRAKNAKAQKAKKNRAANQGQARPQRANTPMTGDKDAVGKALDALERKAVSGQATDADFKGMQEQLAGATAGSGATGELQGNRLRRTVTDLAQRAKSSSLAPEDVAVLREQWIDTRLDRALDGLTERAAKERLSREDFAQLSTLLQERAQAAKALDPKAGMARKRLQASVSRLQQRATDAQVTVADFADLRSDLNTARVERALADLERRSLSKKASQEDVARVTDRINDQASGPHVDPQLAEKLRRAISSLEGRVLRGEVTPEEFATLRSSLTTRARNAASKGK